MTETQQNQYASFEEAFAAAETASERLERGELTLQESLTEYERGARALGECYRILQAAEARLEVLRTQTRPEGDRTSGADWVMAAPTGPLGAVLRDLSSVAENSVADQTTDRPSGGTAEE